VGWIFSRNICVNNPAYIYVEISNKDYQQTNLSQGKIEPEISG
jgi:hypothetical protein